DVVRRHRQGPGQRGVPVVGAVGLQRPRAVLVPEAAEDGRQQCGVGHDDVLPSSASGASDSGPGSPPPALAGSGTPPFGMIGMSRASDSGPGSPPPSLAGSGTPSSGMI